ncbi:MAG: PilX N-terminal domain-containing pilus assembly protein [Gammaproteobacteria bacterium]|nr:PilX N-terminal domain-containing pilus assembly protein [Gammaproteobacteria bacterium]
MKYFHTTFKQNGAALITCLMLLVVMTILGVSSITSSTMEERMAGNILNKHMSFQAAEAALRAGETIAAALPGDAVYTDPTTPASSTDGLYARSEGLDSNFPIWDDPAAAWQDATTAGTIVVQNPQYIIESYSNAPRDADCVLEVPLPAGCMLPVFRITARGWGLNTNGFSMVQSTYKQL